jgi:ABC-2 type transport system permease protein
VNRIWTITKKELATTFGSPMAAIFIGAFLLSTLFSFFWLETFFSRNIADVRPLFRWMPLLMIFLSAALTMRQWSEEQKMGTMEILLTLPVRLSSLVLGKFLAVLLLVGLALVLTLGLPITVSFMGDIDWGPVLGGYLGTLLLAAAYIAIGLFVSSRTDNQIVALILTVLLAGFFYLLGSTGITNFMGTTTSEFFRGLGTGSRFASIERGVLDLRDIVYYTSLTGVFLLLNTVSLDRSRWSRGDNTARHRRGVLVAAGLLAANLLAANIWLAPVHWARLDLTENRDYSISTASADLLASLQEPLIMRGYFSAKTHPLLAPLVPRIRDLLEEYRIAAAGRATVEFIDPRDNPELEGEANELYGIKPLPFQVAGRYESSVVSSYFNILIQYGDQHVVLGFDDLIEIERRQAGQLDVRLRNLEYDLTKSIKKVAYGFQSLATVFEQAGDDLELISIMTPASLPESLGEMPASVDKAMAALQKESGGRLALQRLDPDSGNGPDRSQIDAQFGIMPLAVSFFSEDSFYLHLFLRAGDSLEQIHLAMDMGEGEIRREIEAAMKRTSAGFLQTVGVWTPTDQEQQMYQPQQPPTDSYRLFQEVLRENYNLEKVDLTDGSAPGHLDVLLVVAPHNMTDLERLAVDQYLMRGGSVVALASATLLNISPQSQGLEAKKATDGLADLLDHYGVTVGDGLVGDLQNEPFPIPVTRDIGGFMVQEIQQMDYPFFVDVRSDGMDRDNPMVAALPAVTMNWASPLEIDPVKNEARRVSILLRSSADSWLYEGTSIQPDFQRYPELGFAMGPSPESSPLAVAVQGVFSSFFADRPDPRQEAKKNNAELVEGESLESEDPDTKNDVPPRPILKNSSDAARLIVVGSAEFVNDLILNMSRSLGGDRFLNSLEFLQNTIDWCTEDEGLLAIRSRGAHARLLRPLSRTEQTFFEWLNYGLALVALVGLSIYGSLRRRNEEPMELTNGSL